jgi:NADPH2:quinone reductase
MRALLCREFGPLDTLQVAELPVPQPGPADVLVRVEAAGLNFPDALLVQGRHQLKPPLPYVPGLEFAGVVEACGDDVRGLPPGTPVFGRAEGGALATYCRVPAAHVARRHPSVPADIAAASVVTYATALHALETRAQLAPGESLLVLGAGGGTGSAAVEVGRELGARVIAAASDERKLVIATERGASVTIDYSREDLRERLKAVSGGAGVDVVFDPVGGAVTEPALRSLGWRGRLLVVGFASGQIPSVALNLALLNSRSILGVFLGDWFKRHPADEQVTLARLAAWLAEGRLHPPVTRRVALEDVPHALGDLLARRLAGKVVAIP